MNADAASRHAVVIGAGMGGLCAAAALAAHFDSVTLVERDSLTDTLEARAGTPQARHLHVLLAGGLQALDELLPGFETDLRRAGAVALRGGLDVRVERLGFDPFPARDLDIVLYAMSRPLLELEVRRRVRALASVRILPRCRVLSIATSPDGAAVEGVRCEDGNGVARRLAAELVVDASGRGAPTLACLEAFGLGRAEETVIGVDFGYTTAVYRTPEKANRDWKAVLHLPAAPQSSRGGLLYPMEGDRWILALGARGNDKPPGDEATFLEWTRALRTTTIHDAIQHAERIGGLTRFSFPRSLRRDFRTVRRLPVGLLPFADAICAFNPVYGQGMSVAAQEALLLRRLLAEGHAGSTLAARFFAEVEPVLETPWAMSVLPDLVFPDTTGLRPPDLEQTLRFGAALTRLAARDADAHKLMTEVAQLLKPRSVYREPAFMSRVLAEMAAPA